MRARGSMPSTRGTAPRQDPRRELIDRVVEPRTGNEADVDPGEEPADGEACAEALQRPRARVGRSDESEARVEQARCLAGRRVDETLREAERLEPLAATEEAAVCPERQPSSTGLLESSKPSMWKWCSVKLTESYPRSSASLACSLSSASMRS